MRRRWPKPSNPKLRPWASSAQKSGGTTNDWTYLWVVLPHTAVLAVVGFLLLAAAVLLLLLKQTVLGVVCGVLGLAAAGCAVFVYLKRERERLAKRQALKGIQGVVAHDSMDTLTFQTMTDGDSSVQRSRS